MGRNILPVEDLKHGYVAVEVVSDGDDKGE
jgi:hypothetical protein